MKFSSQIENIFDSTIIFSLKHSRYLSTINNKKKQITRQDAFEVPFLDKYMNEFWTVCFPSLMYSKLNRYGSGLCAFLLAYERFILVCRPTRKEADLNTSKRRKNYLIVTGVILITTTGNLLTKITWNCYPLCFNSAIVNHISSRPLGSVFYWIAP